MNAWLLYLLEANIYVAVFYAFYLLVLKRETFSTINRWFLLAVTAAAFILPLAKAERVVLTAPRLTQIPANLSDQVLAISSYSPVKPAAAVAGQSAQMSYGNVFITACLSISLILIIKLTLNILKIVRLYRRSEKHYRAGGIIHVLLKEKEDVFSFFNWLFYHPKFKNNEAILAHEEVHIRQKHSLDLLFFGLLRAFNWFNPIFKYLLNDVRINHEFIADEIAAGKCPTKYAYATLLIQYADSNNAQTPAHAMFSSRQLKSRINFLAKKRSSKIHRLKLLLVAPILIIVFFISAFKVPKEYGIFKIKLVAKTVTKATSSPTTKVQAVEQIAIQAPPTKSVLTVPLREVNMIVAEKQKVTHLPDKIELEEMREQRTREWTELNDQLADIMAERDATMKKWKAVVDDDASAKESYLQMDRLDAIYKPYELFYPESFIKESASIAANYFVNGTEDERAYLNKIYLLMENYQLFQVTTSKQYQLNTTDPAINKAYFLKRVAVRNEFYAQLNRLRDDIDNNTTGTAANVLQTTCIHLKIYWKKDEMNDKINQRNNVIRAIWKIDEINKI